MRNATLASVRAKLRALVRDEESGAALLEFAIVFPAQLLLTLCIMQFALVLIAHAIVGHAAFAAARAALTADVMRTGGVPFDPNAQQRAAWDAAAVVLGAIASDEGNNVNGMPARPVTWFAGGRPFQLHRQVGAYGKTRVAIVPTPPAAGYIAVRVEHDYVLGIPVANRFFTGIQNFFGPPGVPQDPGVAATGMTAMRIKKVGFLARPWLPATAGGP